MPSARPPLRMEQSFNHRILVPIIVATLCAVLATAFGLYWATSRSDQISIDRQVRETERAVSNSIDALAHDQEIVAIWDDLSLEVRKQYPRWDWVTDNIGAWLYDLFGHDHVYILDGQDRAVYAAIDGAQAAPIRYAAVEGDLKHLIDSVRGRTAHRNTDHERLPGRPLPATSSVRTSEKAVHATHLVRIFGRPAAASAMRVMPLTDQVRPEQGPGHLLVSIRFLDRGFLHELSERNLIEGLRFSPTRDLAPNEEALEITSEASGRIGYFIWRPELPGSKIAQMMGPVTALSILVMLTVMAVLVRRLKRAVRAQQASMDELQAAMVELQASEAHAQHLAFHDTLTGLPNRALLNDRVDQALIAARRDKPATLLLLDLDRFKHVNDTFGHAAGDSLIREFAARLVSLVRESDTVARLGGDEFAILLPGVGDTDDAAALCDRILDAAQRPFAVTGGQAFVGVSIGVAIAPDAGVDRTEIMRKADIALYRAKADGRDCRRLFTPEMDATVRLRGSIEEDLRAALANGRELEVHYQPEVAGPGSPIIGLEALVRWHHPTRGLVSPDQFIPIAEETGLIGQLDDWVLREACAASRRWPDLFIAVNLSPVQFRSSEFAQRVIDIVRSSGANPRSIEIEVTESVLLDNDDVVREGLTQLRDAGFRIALDDFGTGYSSLSYLRQFKVDKIKIDRSFVQHLGQAVDSAAIVTAMVNLGHAMGLTVTAEGVETNDQRHFLAKTGCDVLQGFLFAHALPADEIGKLLESGRHARRANRGT